MKDSVLELVLVGILHEALGEVVLVLWLEGSAGWILLLGGSVQAKHDILELGQFHLT